MRKIVNYGKNVAFAPESVAIPSNVAELRDVVRRAERLRVIGSGHSWSTAIVTDKTLVSLDRMRGILHVDEQNLQVTVQGGIKLHELIAQLDARGLALENLGSIDEQSLAGAIATGTHGSGIAFRCLADQVVALRLVDAEGNDRVVRRVDPDFDAVVVGLGCFGVVHELTLQVVRAFQIRAVTDLAPFDEVIDHLDDYLRGFDHFKFWWLVPSDEVIVYKHRRTHDAPNERAIVRWYRDVFLSVVAYRSVVALQQLDRKRLVPFTNRILSRRSGNRYERICKSHVGFLTPAPPVHRETEFAFDLADAKRLLGEYRRVLLASGHTYNFIQEIRFTKADPFWLSPAYGRDSLWLGMYNMDVPERWDDQLRQFEAFAIANGGRPHWGKEAAFEPHNLASLYPKLEAFRALASAYDPGGKFVNAWVARVLSITRITSRCTSRRA
jgi:L-gulono-1,4-lactone dehydrogenase